MSHVALKYYTFSTPLGPLFGAFIDERLDHLTFDCNTSSTEPASPLNAVQVWLDRYFDGHGEATAVAFALKGTPFQKRVWRALQAIPMGETQSYADIARIIGRPKAYRAVAQACRRNRVALIVPCHRVIASDGRLGGYLGQSHHPLKAALLKHEQRHKGTDHSK